LTKRQLSVLAFMEKINCDVAVNYINFKCEREADLKREGTSERPLRKPKPQKCSVITMKSVSDCFVKHRRFICIQ